MSKVCEYYFAPPSPYAYMGHQRFMELAKKYNVQVIVKPADFGKIFGVSGGLPLAKRAPQRQAYRLVELKRWSEYLNVPLNPQPKHFPVSGDPASRFIIATSLAYGAEAAMNVTGAIMRGVWVEDKNIADADTLAAIGVQFGYDGKALLKSSETASVQSEYDRFTEEAIAANVFGAPWYLFNGEAFWGQDRLDFVERAFASA